MLQAHSVCRATAMYEPACGCPVRQEVRRGELAPRCPLCRQGTPWRLHGPSDVFPEKPPLRSGRARAVGVHATMAWLLQRTLAMARARARGWQEAVRECSCVTALHARSKRDAYLEAGAIRVRGALQGAEHEAVISTLESILRKVALRAH